MKRVIAFGLLLWLAACAAPPCRTHTALYFGSAIGERGEVVSEADWQRFVGDEIATRFPAGFSVVDATGQYRSPVTGNVVSEQTRVLTLIHADEPAIHRSIDAVAQAYKLRFRQESVLRVDQCAAFAF
jgi:hypothetical protein